MKQVNRKQIDVDRIIAYAKENIERKIFSRYESTMV